jgi:hypothetical protein
MRNAAQRGDDEGAPERARAPAEHSAGPAGGVAAEPAPTETAPAEPAAEPAPAEPAPAEPAASRGGALASDVAGAFAVVRRTALSGEAAEERALCSLLAAARKGGMRAALARCGELAPEPRCVSMLVPVFAAREIEVDASVSGALCGRRFNEAVFSAMRRPVSMVLTTGLTLIGCIGFISGL